MPHSLCINSAEQQRLLRAARIAIQSRWQDEMQGSDPLPLGDKNLGNFVSLHIHGDLRGCIGCIETSQALSVTLPHNAQSCAFHDPRFPPLSQSEFAQCQLEISLLSPGRQLAFTNQQTLLQQLDHQHGLILESDGRRAVFLPQVWQQLPEPDQFVNALLRKGGWSRDEWPTDLTGYTFTCLVIAEKLP